MGFKISIVLIYFIYMANLTISVNINEEVEQFFAESSPILKHQSSHARNNSHCLHLRPNATDVVQKVYTYMPYLAVNKTKLSFVHQFRSTIMSMTKKGTPQDQEAAFLASVLTPIIFLQHHKDTWCLMDRFHRALRFFTISSGPEKTSSLQILQNLRSINQKIRSFIRELDQPEAVDMAGDSNHLVLGLAARL
ncbi:unnamed protein product [Plutella xylostella]|uniref:(diamondback moth) hypothetical protein n=1 Tax=Plutella xylostella TaxID=51655 RepID=A0A8S4FP25_PLUXY|nr:unnamed protein product [Plutella xylostella]